MSKKKTDFQMEIKIPRKYPRPPPEPITRLNVNLRKPLMVSTPDWFISIQEMTYRQGMGEPFWVHCSAVRQRVIFVTDRLGPLSPDSIIKVSFEKNVWFPMEEKYHESLEIWFADGRGNIVDIDDSCFSIVLKISKATDKKKMRFKFLPKGIGKISHQG